MARWQRDPRSRRRLSYLLVGVEVVSLTACFLGIFLAYCLRGLLYVGVSPETVHSATWMAGIAATVLCAAVAVVVGLKYLAGKRWPRAVFVVANGILIGLGLFWFVVHQFRHGTSADNTASLVGLLLPMVTLFPLLWPLLRFRPVPEGDPGSGP